MSTPEKYAELIRTRQIECPTLYAIGESITVALIQLAVETGSTDEQRVAEIRNVLAGLALAEEQQRAARAAVLDAAIAKKRDA